MPQPGLGLRCAVQLAPNLSSLDGLIITSFDVRHAGRQHDAERFRDSNKPFISPFEVARQGDRTSGPVSAGLIFQPCLSSPACTIAYADAALAIIDTYEALDLEARALSYHDQIRSEVLADTRKNICCAPNPTLTNQQFEAGFQAVLSTIRGRVAALRADLGAP